jgi:5-methyltetrahydropteroyltriglutamate--homocysteine methyltransferase
MSTVEMDLQEQQRTPRSVARAEPVGSLMRTPAIRSKISEIYGADATPSPQINPAKAGLVAELAQLTDALLPELVRRQVDAGMDVVTDGELGRFDFLYSFYEAVEGIDVENIGTPETGDYFNPVIRNRPVRKSRSPLALEAAAIRASGVTVPFKLTVPPPSYFMWALGDQALGPYDDKDALIHDLEGILIELVSEAVAAGARWIQFDAAIYNIFVDPAFGPALIPKGESLDTMMSKAIAADKRVLEAVPDGVTTAVHLCRGNVVENAGSGALDPVAERMFNELAFDRWLIEWDNPERHGDFSPLRFVGADTIAVLGLVSTKTADMETDDEIVRKVEEASKYLPLDQLAVSPQCGFESMASDNHIDAQDVQWRKLELVGRVADRIWGGR